MNKMKTLPISMALALSAAFTVGATPLKAPQLIPAGMNHAVANLDIQESDSSAYLESIEGMWNQPSHIHSSTVQSHLNAAKQPQYETSRVIAQSNTPPPVYNIALGSFYNHGVSPSNPENWYLFSDTTGGKVTSRLSNLVQPENFDIYLYSKLPTESNYALVAYSLSGGSANEQASTVDVAKDYLLIVRASGSVTTGTFTVGNFATIGFDANEPDDNFWQATEQSTLGKKVGNLDSGFDKDVYKFTLTQEDKINFLLVGADYQAELFYANGVSAAVVPNRIMARANLQPGDYYWTISSPSETGSPNTSYAHYAFKDIHHITLDIETDEQSGLSEIEDYGRGDHHNIHRTGTASGVATDINGNPVEGANIKFTFHGSINGNTTEVYAVTDAQGRYHATLTSPSGRGEYVLDGPRLDSYYDIHRLEIEAVYGATHEVIPSMTVLYDKNSSYDTTSNSLRFNDIAYSIYTGN